MAIRYAIEKHATAYPSNMLANFGGKHIYNIELVSDTDNGCLVAKGDWIELDLYKEATATTFEGVVRDQAANGNWYVEVVNPGDALFVYQVPMIAEEYSNKFQNESNFFNEAGDTVRCYEPAVGDRVEVSAEAIEGTPVKGATVNGVTNKKMTIA